MLIQQQPGYVLHARPYRETSLLLECLTRDHGRLGMIARGARRPRSRLSASVLQPFQPLELSLSVRGDLGTLRAAESTVGSTLLQGKALMAGLYVNELIVRLAARQDVMEGLYARYASLVRTLPDTSVLAWELRRFERDFMDMLGYAMQLTRDADSGEPLAPDGQYVYVPEHGPVMAAAGQRGLRLYGRDFLALAADTLPDKAGLERLRRLQRGLLMHLLGGVPLRSWQVFGGGALSAGSSS